MIPVQNIYYMLSYAFQILNKQGYKDIKTEKFENTSELFAAILSRGVLVQVKRGLGKEYVPKTENLSSLRGRINLTESIKSQILLKKQMFCTYDDFTVNSYMNQIIKSTLVLLLSSYISKTRKKEIKKALVFLGEVDLIDLKSVNWKLNYNSNNKSYRMLISICYLVVKGLLQSKSDGTTRLMDFLDEQRMNRLYEKFLLEYYRKNFPQVTVSASQISWQLDDDFNMMLPVMQTDIMLTFGKKILIIDAKYYSHNTQAQFGVHKIHSNNLYQIFTYVKNKAIELKEENKIVSGMLLYAKTDEAVQPNASYQMSGNTIAVKTLDLNCDFESIANQLNGIIEEYFEI